MSTVYTENDVVPPGLSMPRIVRFRFFVFGFGAAFFADFLAGAMGDRG